MTTQKQLIVIAGNIGVGKSSLTERLAAALGWEPYYEAADENPYLEDFYLDMPRWSFHSQVFFLGRRLENQRQLLQRPESVVQDRSIYEDAEVFASNLYRQGMLSGRDYGTYRTLYDGVVGLLPKPDLLIYLKASVPTLITRIKQRGRQFEQAIIPEYLARLNDLYEDWISAWEGSPILAVQTDSLDFVHNPHDLNMIVEEIQALLAPESDVSE